MQCFLFLLKAICFRLIFCIHHSLLGRCFFFSVTQVFFYRWSTGRQCMLHSSLIVSLMYCAWLNSISLSSTMQSNYISEGKILPLNWGYILTAVCLTQVKSTLLRGSSVSFLFCEKENQKEVEQFSETIRDHRS